MTKRELVIVTGMSGAGKRVAMEAFEDMGYFSVDNLPPMMLPKFWQMIENETTIDKAAVMIDLRSQAFFEDLDDEIYKMYNNHEKDFNLKLLYIDATDETLVARYKETRRQHPLAGEKGTLAGIKREREQLVVIHDMATESIHTDDFAPSQLRNYIIEHYGDDDTRHDMFTIQVLSFGFKYGAPVDADLVVDVRFLKNPYYVKALRELTGLDKPVWDYVWSTEDAQTFYQRESDLIKWLLPRYKAEGKGTLTIAFGCTGGQHRSVAFAHRLAEDLRDDWKVNEYHRDSDRRKESSGRL